MILSSESADPQCTVYTCVNICITYLQLVLLILLILADNTSYTTYSYKITVYE